MAVKAFILDLDGVIIDTTYYHYLAWSQLSKGLGIQLNEEFIDKLKGLSREESLNLILTHGGKQKFMNSVEKEILAKKKDDYYKSLIKRITSKDYLPGIENFLKLLKNNGYKIGIASASIHAPGIIMALGANQYINYIVDPSNIKTGRKYSELFLEVSQFFNVKLNECVGIASTVISIKVLKRLGMFAIAIGNENLYRDADLVFRSTQDINLNKILANKK